MLLAKGLGLTRKASDFLFNPFLGELVTTNSESVAFEERHIFSC